MYINCIVQLFSAYATFWFISCPHGQEALDRLGNKICLDPGSKCTLDESGLCVSPPICTDENGCIQTVIVGDKNFIIAVFVSFIILFRKYSIKFLFNLLSFMQIILLQYFFFMFRRDNVSNDISKF